MLKLSTDKRPCLNDIFDVDQFEEAAKEVADEVTRPRPEGDEEVQDIQVVISSNRNPCGLRDLKVTNTHC